MGIYGKTLSKTFGDFLWTETPRNNYPPYNIIRKSDSEFVVSIAVAGLNMKNVSISVDNDLLTISYGKSNKNIKDDGIDYLYQGISARDFELSFNIQKNGKVTKAIYDNGLLDVIIKIETPKKIKIQNIEIEDSREFLAG